MFNGLKYSSVSVKSEKQLFTFEEKGKGLQALLYFIHLSYFFFLILLPFFHHSYLTRIIL